MDERLLSRTDAQEEGPSDKALPASIAGPSMFPSGSFGRRMLFILFGCAVFWMDLANSFDIELSKGIAA